MGEGFSILHFRGKRSEPEKLSEKQRLREDIIVIIIIKLRRVKSFIFEANEASPKN